MPSQVREKKWDIYYIYGVSLGHIQRYSRLQAEFFPPAGPCPRAAGPRARPCPRELCCRGRKKFDLVVAISLYMARRDPIYIINIPFFSLTCEGIYMPCEGIFMPCEGIYMPCEGIYMPCEGIYMHICPVHRAYLHNDIALEWGLYMLF